MWDYDETKNYEHPCLNAEWDIYTYIIPYLFFEQITPNVLLPLETGTCTSKDIDQRMKTFKIKEGHVAKYIVTPFLEHPLYYFAYTKYSSPSIITNMFFQIVYTLAAFAKIGLRHNDSHMMNVRVLESSSEPFKILYVLRDVKMYCTTKYMGLLYDFDRTGLYEPVSDVTKIQNPCTLPDYKYCNDFNQCATDIKSIRDLIISSYNVYNLSPPSLKKFIYHNIFSFTEEATKHFKKYVIFNRNGDIDFVKSKNHLFMFSIFNDNEIVKYYPTIDYILNSPEFISICISSSDLTLSTIAPVKSSEYAKYSFYDKTNSSIKKTLQSFLKTKMYSL